MKAQNTINILGGLIVTAIPVIILYLFVFASNGKYIASIVLR